MSTGDPHRFLYSIDPPAGWDTEQVLALLGEPEQMVAHWDATRADLEADPDFDSDAWEQTILERTRFLTHVVERINWGAAEYGDESLKRPLWELLEEIAEEAADIGGWGVLANGAAHRDLDDGALAVVYEMLREAIAHAMQAHTLVRRARDLSRGLGGQL